MVGSPRARVRAFRGERWSSTSPGRSSSASCLPSASSRIFFQRASEVIALASADILPGSMHESSPQSLTRTAFQATVHCLTGCAIGEVLGLVLSTALGWHDLPSILLAIVLAFGFGYGLTIRPLLG